MHSETVIAIADAITAVAETATKLGYMALFGFVFWLLSRGR